MGTNYYWTPEAKACPTCGHDPSEPLHIGKSSAGWCFSLNTHPGISSLDDWRSVWRSGKIHDEYGMEVTPEQMEATITERSSERPVPMHLGWLRENSAERGPKNLARHKVDGSHCIAHGDGTYDLMKGEFF